MFGSDVVVYSSEIFGGKLLGFGFDDSVEIVLGEEQGDVMLLAETVKHLLVPLREIGSAVVGKGKTDFLFFGKAGAANSDHFVAVGLDNADPIDASLFSAFDSAVASEDAIVLVDDD